LDKAKSAKKATKTSQRKAAVSKAAESLIVLPKQDQNT
jgi:hypothetical protein